LDHTDEGYSDIHRYLSSGRFCEENDSYEPQLEPGSEIIMRWPEYTLTELSLGQQLDTLPAAKKS
jgi:hypothetical protein